MENLLRKDSNLKRSRSHQFDELKHSKDQDESLSSCYNTLNSSYRRHSPYRSINHPSILLASAILICSILPTTATNIRTTTCFINPPNLLSNISSHKTTSILSRKTPFHRSNLATRYPSTSWSNAVRQKSNLNESRFGVRRRVKKVLDKAKKRTGIDNNSSCEKNEGYVQSDVNIVAEAASIGGWGAVILDDEGYVDVTLDDGRGESVYEDVVAEVDVGELTVERNGVNAEERNGARENVPSDTSTEEVISSTISNSTGAVDTSEPSTKATVQPVSFEPLPFTMPTLSPNQKQQLIKGERVQFQDDMGRAGSGFVVWDVKAPPSVVWDCLLDFQSYPQTIPTVREVVMYTNTHLKQDYRAEKPLDFEDGTAAICKHGIPSVTRAQFSLSKFRLKIAAVHKYRPHPQGDYMIFTLDPASRNMVLKYAKGIWHTQSNPDGKEGYTRVWLLCELSVSRLLPQWIVDYAAARAMPRATTWLKPQVEAAAVLWLREKRD